MKQIIYVSMVLMLLSFDVFSQNNKCNCLENLNKLIAKTEENYAGFPTKVNKITESGYKELIISLKKKTNNETNPKTCFYLLKSYIRFFKDKHFNLSYSNVNDYDIERIVYSEKYFKDRLAKKGLSEIEGIWVNADTTIKLAIQKFNGNIFKGIVLEAEDPKIPVGLVYLTLSPSKDGFIAKEFNSFITTDIPAKQKGNLLQIDVTHAFSGFYKNMVLAVGQNPFPTN